MKPYVNQKKFHVAVDCIIFGYDGLELKLLLVQRGFKPLKGQWSLVGGFVKENESAEDAASRVLKDLTGLEGIYMQQLNTFSKPGRDTQQRTISIAFFALIDLQKYEQQMSEDSPGWFPINHFPALIFDHNEIVEMAKEKLRYKAALHPILIELLPSRFTIPQLQNLYTCVYNMPFDKGNFTRKILSTGLLVKLNLKDMLGSKKGAYYYKVDSKKYRESFHTVLNFVPAQYSTK